MILDLGNANKNPSSIQNQEPYLMVCRAPGSLVLWDISVLPLGWGEHRRVSLSWVSVPSSSWVTGVWVSLTKHQDGVESWPKGERGHSVFGQDFSLCLQHAECYEELSTVGAPDLVFGATGSKHSGQGIHFVNSYRSWQQGWRWTVPSVWLPGEEAEWLPVTIWERSFKNLLGITRGPASQGSPY